MCTVQCRGAVPEIRDRSDGVTDVPAAADTEAGSVPAGAAPSAARHAANDGQRRHVLRASLPLHLHLQVFPRRAGVGFRGFGFGFRISRIARRQQGHNHWGGVGGTHPPKKNLGGPPQLF